MKSILYIVGLVFLLTSCYGQGISPEIQIKAAVLAAPQDMRAEAKVYGYSNKGEFTELRKGSNSMICLSDNPSQKGFNVACYYKDLDEFMARGRALKAEGKSFKEIFDIREEEVKAGNLKIPQNSSLYVLSGPDEVFNAETGEVTGANLRSVVYIPFATSESTGLPLKPAAPGMPWIMDPGTHRAHIMITPPQKEN